MNNGKTHIGNAWSQNPNYGGLGAYSASRGNG